MTRNRRLAGSFAVAGAAMLAMSVPTGILARQDVTRVVKGAEPKQAISREILLQVLDEATKGASALKDARSRAQMFAAIATTRARVGEPAAARGAFQQAIRAAVDIEDAGNRIYTLEDIATAQSDSGDRPAGLATMRHVSEVIDRMDDEFQRLSARSWIVRTFARAGEFDAALKMSLDLPDNDLFQKSRALTNVLEGLKPSGRATMRKALPALLQAAASVHSETFEADCLRGFAGVLWDTSDVEDIRKIAEILEKAAAAIGPQDASGHYLIHNEIQVLSALAKAEARAGKREAAVETFRKAVELARRMPPEGEALRSSRLATVAQDRVHANDIDGAEQTVEHIVYEYHKANALIAIAEALAKAGRREESLAMFRKAVQAAREIKVRDPLRDRQENYDLNMPECLRRIAYVQAKAGFAAEAIRTAETIGEPRWQNSAFGLIAMAMARRGEFQPAVDLVARIDDSRAKAKALQDIAEGRAEAGDLPGALAWARGRTTPEARAIALLGIMRSIARPAGAAD